ncbi:hypothetical protein H257_14553 [Aphanomyces astaci]|uniref:Uncharacterized protein n=1 Tax=Aphanomyces astaci TaxID=112090 RepID=W4FQD7_APHAT|nr:hypothetical protein H257_14553 [Aphanomyces astaci]ETV69690.1 hypothetical protein H257_14553 [Aphanomyces astaci]|eukprot:XP_009840704.1 hypothetical protein H257_14553 [Aphanomyces astaci]
MAKPLKTRCKQGRPVDHGHALDFGFSSRGRNGERGGEVARVAGALCHRQVSSATKPSTGQKPSLAAGRA